MDHGSAPLRSDHAGSEAGFDYVINPPIIPRVCFGSGMERVTLPLSGPALSSFMRQLCGEVREFPGPSDYCVSKSLEKNFPSKLGFSVFASKTLRLPSTTANTFPAFGTYDVEKSKIFRQCYKPFGSGARRVERDTFLTPGPPTYSHNAPKRKAKLASAFGSHRIIWPEVAVFCSPYNTSKCWKCGSTPFGDYWHNFNSKLDLCRPCMNKEQHILKQCSTDVFLRIRARRELEKYNPVRYCGFFHDHNGTTAATQLIPTKTLLFKIKKENYLYGYNFK